MDEDAARTPSLHLSTHVDRPADEVYAYVVGPRPTCPSGRPA